MVSILVLDRLGRTIVTLICYEWLQNGECLFLKDQLSARGIDQSTTHPEPPVESNHTYQRLHVILAIARSRTSRNRIRSNGSTLSSSQDDVFCDKCSSNQRVIYQLLSNYIPDEDVSGQTPPDKRLDHPLRTTSYIDWITFDLG